MTDPLATATTAARLAAAAAMLIAVYAAVCAVSPFPTCRRCGGKGERQTLLGRTGRCRRCRGTGRRARLGRRIFNYFARLRGRAVTSKER